MKRQLLREILLLIALSAIFGFTYTLIAKKGFFTEARPLPTSKLEIIPLAKTKEYFESGTALFLDTRHEFDYNAGHIHAAINIALNEFEKHRIRLEGIQKNKLLILYCDGADCNSSIELAAKLIELGYINVKVFYGGWQEWRNAGLPIEK